MAPTGVVCVVFDVGDSGTPENKSGGASMEPSTGAIDAALKAEPGGAAVATGVAAVPAPAADTMAGESDDVEIDMDVGAGTDAGTCADKAA